MAKPKSLAEVKEQIAKVENDIRQGENKVKRLFQKNHQQERKDRTHRLIKRGAILESQVPNAVQLSNEQIKKLLQYALGTGVAKEIISGYIKALAENPASITETSTTTPSRT